MSAVVEPIHFVEVDGQTILGAPAWPTEVDWSREVVDSSPLISLDGDKLNVAVANGFATYLIVTRKPGTGIVEPLREVLHTHLVQGHVQETPIP